MSTSVSRQLPSRKPEQNQAVIGITSIALGLITAIILTGQWPTMAVTVNAVLIQIGHWLGATAATDSKVYWYMARSAGIVAYLLLWGSVAFGIMVSDKILDGLVKAPVVFEVHKFLSILALIAGLFHGVILLGDSFMKFTVFDILIPFLSPYQPFWVGMGILSLYLIAILVGSFYIKKRIGHRTWKLIHTASFAVWIMTSLHGIFAGTDSSQTLVQLMYTLAIVSVGYLLTYRIIAAKSEKAAKQTARVHAR